MYCRNCGAKKGEEQLVCEICGASGGEKYCPFCGAVTPMGAKACDCCKQVLNTKRGPVVTPDRCRVGAVSAFIASLLLPGLGQVINGQYGKGFSWFLLFAVIMAGFRWSWVYFAVMAASAVDAAIQAKKLRCGESVGVWRFF